MKIIAFNPFKHLEYARSVLQVPISASTGGIVALDANGKPQGIVLLDNWAENSVMGHVAIQHPMAMRNIPKEIMKYVFIDCDKKMFLGVIPSDNPKSFKFHKNLGFKVIHTIIDGYADGIDIILVQLLRENCKQIKHLSEVA